MFLKKSLFLIFLICTNSLAFANSKEFVFPKGNLAILAPPFINKDYFGFEFGFLTEKKIKVWDYNYNAYVTATLYQDALNKTDKLKAGGLGFRGGVMAPTQPWIPLLFTLTGGFAKTALHKNPFLGRDQQSVDKKDMFSIEAGLLYRYDKYFLRFAYQISNVKYFSRHTILTLGVVY